jgi:short-subunit dehydrogenase
MRDLQGKRVLITGAGGGLGRALTIAFAAAGANIVATDLNEQALAELRATLKTSVVTYPLDVTQVADIAAVRQQLLAEHGPIDVLINNAGVVHGGAFLETSLDQHHRTLSVNTLGTLNVSHVFLPDLLEQPEAHLLNVVSASAVVSMPHGVSYAASKWGALGFSESLAAEMRLLGHRHLCVTALCPSYIDTGMFAGVRMPRFFKMYTPEYIAGRALRAVQRKQELVLLPWYANLSPLVRHLLPRSWFHAMQSSLRISQGMGTWQGRDR